MSTRTHLAPHYILNASDMTQTLSGVTILKSLSVVSYEIFWAGTSPVGAITVQLSNSYRQNPDGTILSPGMWTDIPFQNSTGTVVQSIPIAANSGSGFIDVRITGAGAIKIIYTPASGTGDLTVVVSGKVT